MSQIKYTSAKYENRIIFVLLGLFISIVAIARYHLLSIPLERDEGEYAYMAKLILDGHPPYTLACNMKLPGTYYMYALIMKIFGGTDIGIHTGLAIIHIASVILLFRIVDKLIGKNAAIISAITFGVVSTSWTVLGQAAHATQFVNLFSLLGINTILKKNSEFELKRWHYILSGIYFSLAFICKQSGIFFLVAGISIAIINSNSEYSLKSIASKVICIIIGFIAPIFDMVIYFYIWGDFESFKFWTIDFLSQYGNTVPLSMAPEMFLSSIKTITNNYTSEGYIALWVISILGIIVAYNCAIPKANKMKIYAFVIFSFLTIVPGFYFRQHYYITYLPAMSIAASLFFEFIRNKINKHYSPLTASYIPLIIFLVVISYSIDSNADYLFTGNNLTRSKNIYRLNPFAESIEIGNYIKKNTLLDDKIAILGSEPQILFYADRYSATRHIYAYNWVEDQSFASKMQDESIKEIEINKPEYILYVNIDASWLLRPNSDEHIFKWANEYIAKNYHPEAIVNVKSDTIEPIISEDALSSFRPTSKDLIFIYKKNKTS